MQKTIYIVFGLLLFAGLLVYIAMRPPQQPATQDTKLPTSAIVPTVTVDTTLTLVPQTISLATNPAGKVDVVVDSGKNQLSAVQVELAYDPKVLTNVQVTPGTFFESKNVILQNHDRVNGRISYAIGITPSQQPVSGGGIFATISFTQNPLGNSVTGSTEISILPKSLASELGVRQSVIKNTVSATVMLPSVTPSTSQPEQQVPTP